MVRWKTWWSRSCLAASAILAFTSPAAAQWQPDPSDDGQVRAASAIADIVASNPASREFLEAAHGYAVMPGITRFALGFGAAWGKGVVIERDVLIGTTRYWQFSSGIQGGLKNFAMIVFFRDQEAIDDFKSGKFQFAGQAGIDVGTWGAHGTPAWNDGVAVFVDTNLGLMAEFSYSGIKFNFRPLPPEP